MAANFTVSVCWSCPDTTRTKRNRMQIMCIILRIYSTVVSHHGYCLTKHNLDTAVIVSNGICINKIITQYKHIDGLVQMSSNSMDLLQDTKKCGSRMHRECWKRFPRHRLQIKPLVSDPGMHHGPCMTHVPWCMSGSLNRGGGGNVPGIPGACAARNFTYLVKGPLLTHLGRCSLALSHWYKLMIDAIWMLMNSQRM